MGIPFYFKKLTLSFGSQFIQKVQLMEECDNMYLDFNSMIHQCANDIVEKNASFTFIQEYYPLIANALIDAIINICNIVRPKKVLYIAIDGMCPRAKMQQQRKRRYISVWRNRMEGKNRGVWDSNVITPGTEFMEFLDKELEAFIEKNKVRLGFQIILSKSSEVGEGEHKMFDIIQDEDAVIYGLDADLIMLSMISQNKSIRLLREQAMFGSPNVQGSFALLNINKLKTLIETEYNIPIADYVMICTLLGNDFIPPLSYLSMRGNGVETLIEAYKQIDSKIINDERLDIQTLYKIFAVLAKTEDEGMTRSCDLYYTMKAKSTKRLDCYPQYTKCKYIIDPKNDSSWRESYYNNIVKTNTKTACIEYIRGLYWMYDYYFKRNASKFWYYPYLYSPTIMDLQHISKYRIDPYVCNDSLDPRLQLLLVLPPQSIEIIRSKEEKELITNMDYGFVHCFPIDFQVSTFLKTYLWECSPILPDMNVQQLGNRLNLVKC